MFNKDIGYLTLPQFITEEDADSMSNYILNQVGFSEEDKDPQSEGAYGFNTVAKNKGQLFDDFAIKIESELKKITEKNLKYTYTYVRLYSKGCDLEPHTDRDACEYSLSVTLDSSDNKNPWPIFIKEDEDKDVEIHLNKGDALLFDGINKEHWRQTLNKDWQLQAFFHYVDEQGEYSKELGESVLNNNEIYFWSFTEQEGIDNNVCDVYANKYSNTYLYEAEVGYNADGTVNKNIRNVLKADLDTFSGITGMHIAAALCANDQAWNFNLDFCSQSEFLLYPGDGGKYDTHTDSNISNVGDTIRKLTALSVLNDDFEGGRFYIITAGGDKIYPPQNKGDIIIFPSLLRHGCEPVTSGERKAVVTWINGEFFK